eukprot:6173623-Pleurochrysis_carterae.AAC.1
MKGRVKLVPGVVAGTLACIRLETTLRILSLVPGWPENCRACFEIYHGRGRPSVTVSLRGGGASRLSDPGPRWTAPPLHVVRLAKLSRSLAM